MIKFDDRPGEQVILTGRSSTIVHRKNALLGITEGGQEIRGTTVCGLVNIDARPHVQLVDPKVDA